MRAQQIKFTCDYCKTTETFAADRPLTEQEAKDAARWINVLMGGQQFNYDRVTCAVNGIRLFGASESGLVVPGVEEGQTS